MSEGSSGSDSSDGSSIVEEENNASIANVKKDVDLGINMYDGEEDQLLHSTLRFSSGNGRIRNTTLYLEKFATDFRSLVLHKNFAKYFIKDLHEAVDVKQKQATGECNIATDYLLSVGRFALDLDLSVLYNFFAITGENDEKEVLEKEKTNSEVRGSLETDSLLSVSELKVIARDCYYGLALHPKELHPAVQYVFDDIYKTLDPFGIG
eukprot:snap_masked-scaffold_3-processed-gene-19.42-mRNA-1 protein AED:1.00 eAED:1.00 QI:0/0/0/0/1/1/2/0/207